MSAAACALAEVFVVAHIIVVRGEVDVTLWSRLSGATVCIWTFIDNSHAMGSEVDKLAALLGMDGLLSPDALFTLFFNLLLALTYWTTAQHPYTRLLMLSELLIVNRSLLLAAVRRVRGSTSTSSEEHYLLLLLRPLLPALTLTLLTALGPQVVACSALSDPLPLLLTPSTSTHRSSLLYLQSDACVLSLFCFLVLSSLLATQAYLQRRTACLHGLRQQPHPSALASLAEMDLQSVLLFGDRAPSVAVAGLLGAQLLLIIGMCAVGLLFANQRLQLALLCAALATALALCVVLPHLLLRCKDSSGMVAAQATVLRRAAGRGAMDRKMALVDRCVALLRECNADAADNADTGSSG